MAGMCRFTGKLIDENAHIMQCIDDILSTVVGSMPIVRDLGVNYFNYIDKNIDKELKVNIYADVADVINKWEPRVKVNQVKLINEETIMDGTFEFLIDVTHIETGKQVVYNMRYK